MSQRIADASAKVARSSYPLPRRRTTSFRPLWDNWPSFPEKLDCEETGQSIAISLSEAPPLAMLCFALSRRRRLT
jgi:hypothetical protein